MSLLARTARRVLRVLAYHALAHEEVDGLDATITYISSREKKAA